MRSEYDLRADQNASRRPSREMAVLIPKAALPEKGSFFPEAELLLQVHDELIVECPEDEAERVREILKTEMEHTAELSVPLTVDAHIGHSWAEAH